MTVPADGAMCAAHPRQNAVADCASCGKPICEVCVFEVSRQHYCSDCGLRAAKSPAPASRPVLTTAFNEPATLIGGYEAPPSATLHVPAGLKCVQHLTVDAVAQCNACSSGMCATCDFAMPNGMHFCPACIDNAGSDEISPKRKKLAIAAIVIAAFCTLLYGMMITGALYRALGSPTDVQSFGCLVLLMVYAPAIVGTGIAATAFNRRLRNTTLIWTALVWNVVITACLVITLIIGVART